MLKLLILFFSVSVFATENVEIQISSDGIATKDVVVESVTGNVEVSNVIAEDTSITGLEVMNLVREESRKKNTRVAVVDMKIFDSENRERVRYFNYWTKYFDGQENSLIKFFSDYF